MRSPCAWPSSRDLPELDLLLGASGCRRTRCSASGALSATAHRLVPLLRSVAELEGLMAGMRAREFRTELAGERAGGSAAVAAERSRALEEQVRRHAGACGRARGTRAVLHVAGPSSRRPR